MAVHSTFSLNWIWKKFYQKNINKHNIAFKIKFYMYMYIYIYVLSYIKL